jgi:carboxypeptidase C (cathepsin A)
MNFRGAWAVVFLCPLALCADEPKSDKPAEPPAPVVTQHSIKINGKQIDYTATAGMLAIRDDAGKPIAYFFHVAYTKNAADEKKRPITFTFNGGPGSSSVWLHMGAFGPKRVTLNDSGEPLPPPTKLVDNDLSILDLTDLVFIDPVSTGYSRAAPGQDAKKFHGVQEDIDSVGEFIRLYTTRNHRWGSPKFLAGESYGTTRASALAGHMQDRHGMNFNGVILISAILNFETARFDQGNDLPYALFLPSFTATAWYHKKLPASLSGDLPKALKEVEKFVEEVYEPALFKGDKLADAEQKRIAEKLAGYTGLSADYIERTNLRPEIMRFTKELLRSDRHTVGRFDSRMKGIDTDAAGERHEYDPSYATVQGAYTSTLNEYVRDALKYENDAPYEILTGKVQPWNFGDAQNRFLNVAPALRSAMTKNRDLRVFLACGYYDLATPYFAAEYTMNHLNLDRELKKHITTTYYEAGHMMYVHRPSHEKLKKDLADFYGATLQ